MRPEEAATPDKASNLEAFFTLRVAAFRNIALERAPNHEFVDSLKSPVQPCIGRNVATLEEATQMQKNVVLVRMVVRRASTPSSQGHHCQGGGRWF